MSVSPKLILPTQSTTALKTMNICALSESYPLSIIIDATKIFLLKSSKSGDMIRMDGHLPRVASYVGQTDMKKSTIASLSVASSSVQNSRQSLWKI